MPATCPAMRFIRPSTLVRASDFIAYDYPVWVSGQDGVSAAQLAVFTNVPQRNERCGAARDPTNRTPSRISGTTPGDPARSPDAWGRCRSLEKPGSFKWARRSTTLLRESQCDIYKMTK